MLEAGQEPSKFNQLSKALVDAYNVGDAKGLNDLKGGQLSPQK